MENVLENNLHRHPIFEESQTFRVNNGGSSSSGCARGVADRCRAAHIHVSVSTPTSVELIVCTQVGRRVHVDARQSAPGVSIVHATAGNVRERRVPAWRVLSW